MKNYLSFTYTIFFHIIVIVISFLYCIWTYLRYKREKFLFLRNYFLGFALLGFSSIIFVLMKVMRWPIKSIQNIIAGSIAILFFIFAAYFLIYAIILEKKH